MSTNLSWKTERNLENSLAEFLQSVINDDNLIVKINGINTPISIKIGFTPDDTWKLPVISLYIDSKDSIRACIGSSRRIKTYLLIIDIRATDTGMLQDLVDWVEETINDGFPFKNYEPAIDRDNPLNIQQGHVAVDFLTNRPIRFIDNVDEFEKYRQNISISCNIEYTN